MVLFTCLFSCNLFSVCSPINIFQVFFSLFFVHFVIELLFIFILYVQNFIFCDIRPHFENCSFWTESNRQWSWMVECVFKIEMMIGVLGCECGNHRHLALVALTCVWVFWGWHLELITIRILLWSVQDATPSPPPPLHNFVVNEKTKNNFGCLCAENGVTNLNVVCGSAAKLCYLIML